MPTTAMELKLCVASIRKKYFTEITLEIIPLHQFYLKGLNTQFNT